MTASIAQAPTALDDAIVRNAEATLETIGRAREAIHSVIFGQEQVVDLTLVTLLVGRTRRFWSAFRAWPRPSWSRRWASCSGSTPGGSSSRPT